MGVLTDLVVVDRSQAQLVCETLCPSKTISGLDAKGIDTVKLGKLYALLTQTPFDPAFMSAILAEASEDGPWVMEVPPNFVQRLASLNEQQLSDVSAQWAKAPEFSPPYGHWSVENVHTMATLLAQLCAKAVSERSSVLMWMCL